MEKPSTDAASAGPLDAKPLPGKRRFNLGLVEFAEEGRMREHHEIPEDELARTEPKTNDEDILSIIYLVPLVWASGYSSALPSL